jgi:hypothetical protein
VYGGILPAEQVGCVKHAKRQVNRSRATQDVNDFLNIRDDFLKHLHGALSCTLPAWLRRTASPMATTGLRVLRRRKLERLSFNHVRATIAEHMADLSHLRRLASFREFEALVSSTAKDFANAKPSKQ